MREIEAKQLKKTVNGCSNEVAATAALLSLSASPAAAPAQPPTRAGFITFSNGISIPADLQVDPEPDEGEWSRGRPVPVSEFYETLQREKMSALKVARRLRFKVKMIGFSFALVQFTWRLVLKRVANKLSFKPTKPRLRKSVVATPKRVRSSIKHRKAKDEDAEGDADSHSDFWFASVKPRAERAPTFALPAWRGAVVDSLVWLPTKQG